MSALKADPAAPSHYLRSKAAGERAVREGAGEGLAWTLFRPSVVFGPEDQLFNRFARLLRLSPVLPLARPNARFAPVYVGDVVEAFTVALQDLQTRGVAYELCGPHVWSLRELVELTADTLSIRRRILVLPNVVARVQARLMEWLPGKPFSIDNYQSLTVHSLCEPSMPGLKSLGIDPTAVEAVIGSYLGAANAGSPATASSSRMREPRSG
jgi:NADH dehydrogenase